LASLTNLMALGVSSNQISDISPLSNLTSLTRLILDDNQISDLSPLVKNSGLDTEDVLLLGENNLDLSEGSQDMENIRALEDRGVVVRY
jgi:Leucine-rich repeat (LRR) protein